MRCALLQDEYSSLFFTTFFPPIFLNTVSILLHFTVSSFSHYLSCLVLLILFYCIKTHIFRFIIGISMHVCRPAVKPNILTLSATSERSCSASLDSGRARLSKNSLSSRRESGKGTTKEKKEQAHFSNWKSKCSFCFISVTREG